MIVVMLDPRATPDHVGLIPSFLSDEDPRPAAEQFAENYAFGGGWSDFPGFQMDPKKLTLKYPGDPPYRPLAFMRLRDETILIYPHAWVAIVQPDGKFSVSRMD